VYWLDTRPELRDRLRAELAEYSDPVAAADHPLLAAVCDEVLRISPILPEVVRTLQRPLTLGRYRLPAGAHVSTSMAVAHASWDTFPEPHRFLPERFLARRFGPFEFFPWGGGARRCLGAGLAGLELRTILATVLLRFRLRSLNHGPVRTARHTANVWPTCGLPAVYEGRR
jgi:cytochrome P450